MKFCLLVCILIPVSMAVKCWIGYDHIRNNPITCADTDYCYSISSVSTSNCTHSGKFTESAKACGYTCTMEGCSNTTYVEVGVNRTETECCCKGDYCNTAGTGS
ncbi:hypothetical protein PMAYCL1PPCAC_11195 [Pristionchus mayeri]|uniref:UPAR/Ly6 domain-containing protein n=1 Tax=Pristionchus mayeri TaxID=1317129 RepID=A0AAN5CDF2_9BILA|nr:hypothetical protein PMAYCL1PPCAC_11195 [Pristionchus mayeri]